MLGRASPPFCPTVERVLLNSCPRLTDRGLQTLSRRCPELRHIELRGCAQLTDVGVLELVSKCVHLNHLDVSGTCVRLDFFFPCAATYCYKVSTRCEQSKSWVPEG